MYTVNIGFDSEFDQSYFQTQKPFFQIVFDFFTSQGTRKRIHLEYDIFFQYPFP